MRQARTHSTGAGREVAVSAARQTDALVVGAGPTGLVAALSLAKAGLAVEIIDEAWRPAGHSYALALHPRSLLLLDELGVAAAAIEQGRKLASFTLLAGDEARLSLRCGTPDERFPYLLSLPQSALERLLWDALARQGVKVRWSHRLAGLEPHDDGVVATVERLEKESGGYGVAHTEWAVAATQSFRSGFVIGADGHRSLVRRALGTPLDEVAPSQVFAIVECTAPSTGDEERLVLREDSVNALWPLPEGRARWSLEVKAPDVSAADRYKGRLTTMLGERFFPHLDESRTRALLAERASWFASRAGEIGWSIEVCFERRLAASFGRGRVWLAGDAAHLTGPAGMQSMNAGLGEAHQLATTIARIRRGHAGLEELEAYGRERLADWGFLLGLRGGLRPNAGASDFVAQNAARLLPCLPATTADLPPLAAQLGLDVDRG
jgi:2-polyprenyl-6-methoxyphenol hydroxylase-like FAD-dependent oxidoreductase